MTEHQRIMKATLDAAETARHVALLRMDATQDAYHEAFAVYSTAERVASHDRDMALAARGKADNADTAAKASTADSKVACEVRLLARFALTAATTAYRASVDIRNAAEAKFNAALRTDR